MSTPVFSPKTDHALSTWTFRRLAKDSVQQKFRSFWKTVVEALKNADGVLGYDLVNAS